MAIQNCIPEDVDFIYKLYEDARQLQTAKRMVVWPYFSVAFLEEEIHNKQQWKLLINEVIACNWTISFTDKAIWGARDKNDAIYIHRIVTNPNFSGNNFVKAIAAWAKIFAAKNQDRKSVV